MIDVGKARRVGRITILSAMLVILILLPGMTRGQGINQPVTVDGNPADWDLTWQVATDPANDTCGDLDPDSPGIECPHDPPFCARTGYDLVSISAHWNADTWYFLVLVDGLPGDSDSAVGSCPDALGVGTTDNDGGPFNQLKDKPGIGSGEQYTMVFYTTDDDDDYLEAQLLNCASPGVTCPLAGDVVGVGAYGSTANPGAIEFGVSESELYPAGECSDRLETETSLGSNRDLLGEDYTEPQKILVLQTGLSRSHSPMVPVVGQSVTLYYDYDLTGAGGVPATGATIVDSVDPALTYQSCTAPAGGSCSYDSGSRQFTCILPTPMSPTSAGQCAMVATYSTDAKIQNRATMTCNEGLCAQATDGWTPTAVKLLSFTAAPAAGDVALDWETASEIDNVGFNLYRRQYGTESYVQLNNALIPSVSPGGGLGGRYSWTDAAVTAGVVYEYLLEDVDLYGTRTPHGPVEARADYAVWLPIVAR